MNDWQTMETAPTDMRPILVFVRGTWETPDSFHVAFRKREGVWVLQDEDHSIVEATHWMPLPAAPQSK